MTPRGNVSILDRNIEHALGVHGAEAVAAFWRFRDKHSSLEAERRAELAARCQCLLDRAFDVLTPLHSAADRSFDRAATQAALSGFVTERIHHLEAKVFDCAA